jgi:hypothetical protein
MTSAYTASSFAVYVLLYGLLNDVEWWDDIVEDLDGRGLSLVEERPPHLP